MKNQIIFLILIAMNFFATAQNTVYDSKGKSQKFETEEISLIFTESDVEFSQPSQADGQELAAATLLTFLPQVVDGVFQLTSKYLEKRAQSYTAEYSAYQSNLFAGSFSVPNLHFQRVITLKEGDSNENALDIKIIALKLENMDAFVYYVSAIDLGYSQARVKAKKNKLDYVIEIRPTILHNGQKQVHTLSPITISSVKFGSNAYADHKVRTDLIPLPAGATVSEVSIKIVETNPAKVRAEKILQFWNSNQEAAKTELKKLIENQTTGGKKTGKSSKPNQALGN